MASTMRKMMEYLSLAEPHDDYEDEATAGAEHRGEERRSELGDGHHRREAQEHRAPVTPISSAAAFQAENAPAEDLRRIVTVHPSGYNEARVIGESFRSGTPVIVNLTGMAEPDAKRMVDFSAGLVLGLRGTMERVTNRVFLLSPASVEVGGGHERDLASPVFAQD
ncbi:cell division protein SepF [Bogoriella caseilytica]|uniref:Cell division protein SepF n=1 Tax=Bogoriella caseilytica TaxID=56055 RepID=A0A3N2B984_9MICO|nr:cell division protein SepF [Bogoriella caseilytica]ROR71835.1 cell division inhibitor SepF [Bogoriella caseilytica]